MEIRVARLHLGALPQMETLMQLEIRVARLHLGALPQMETLLGALPLRTPLSLQLWLPLHTPLPLNARI